MFFQENGQYRCAVYLRLSRSDGDQQESNSIKNQRALLNDYLGKHPELHKVDEYVDDGYSGTNFERPDFKRMMQDIEKRNVNCIIVKDLSRFGRNYIETGRYLERIFPFMGMYRLVTSGTEKAISDGRLTQKRRPASERCLIWHYLDAIQRRLPMP